MNLGYARVSTNGQMLDGQLVQLRAAGCTRIFREKITGIHADRRELRRLLSTLRPGDVLVVTRLDRLARSTRDLLNVVATVKDRGAGFRSLADAWADTTTAHGCLMLTILGGVAEFEHHLIRQRTAEGRARARARGVKFGRRPKLDGKQRTQALVRRDAGEPRSAIARAFNVSPSTIARLRP